MVDGLARLLGEAFLLQCPTFTLFRLATMMTKVNYLSSVLLGCVIRLRVRLHARPRVGLRALCRSYKNQERFWGGRAFQTPTTRDFV